MSTIYWRRHLLIGDNSTDPSDNAAGSGNDVITGSGQLYGGGGDDQLSGSGFLSGGEGNDISLVYRHFHSPILRRRAFNSSLSRTAAAMCCSRPMFFRRADRTVRAGPPF